MLKKSVIIIMGGFKVSVTHLFHLLYTENRLQHGLTATDLNGHDKMNFRAVQRMTSPAVIELLKKQEDAMGTALYLEVMGDIMAAFLDEDLTARQRLHMLWRATFFFRDWRNWLLAGHYSLPDNYITINSFVCEELNTHGATKLVRKLRDDGHPELFLPALLSSQPCEGRFRALRSQTSTQHTVVNVSMREALRRDARVQLQGDIVCLIGSEFRFPRYVAFHIAKL